MTMLSKRFGMSRRRHVLPAAKRLLIVSVLCVSLGGGAAQAEQRRWYVWDQHLLELSELIGAMHYLRRLCVDYRDQLWKWRMEDVLEWEYATGERRYHLVSRFNRGYRETRQWHDRCSISARLRIEHLEAQSVDLLDWFAANAVF